MALCSKTRRRIPIFQRPPSPETLVFILSKKILSRNFVEIMDYDDLKSPEFLNPSPIFLPPTHRPTPVASIPANNRSSQSIIFSPVPQPQRVSVVPPHYHFQAPYKRIHSPDDIHHFHDSDSGRNFLGFIVAVSESARCRRISDSCFQFDNVNSIVSILDALIRWVDEIPPAHMETSRIEHGMRGWWETAILFMFRFLHENLQSAAIEIVPYFTDSFGKSSRIDYGTGHENEFRGLVVLLGKIGGNQGGGLPGCVNEEMAAGYGSHYAALSLWMAHQMELDGRARLICKGILSDEWQDYASLEQKRGPILESSVGKEERKKRVLFPSCFPFPQVLVELSQ
ncbi:Serine/threonine-protein phosphatase 2A activator, partial [Cucurbita argyrosperma subsp. sororia]